MLKTIKYCILGFLIFIIVVVADEDVFCDIFFFLSEGNPGTQVIEGYNYLINYKIINKISSSII